MLGIATFLLSLQSTFASAPNTPPNIVMIMIDDLGWSDLRCQGNRLVETPHLDQFAKESMRFTNAYAAAPVCSPTRAAVLTGQSPARLRITNHIPDRPSFTPPNATHQSAEMRDHLPLEKRTIAELLKEEGYNTAFLGKWHLSGRGKGNSQFEPTQQGFDLNIGGCGYGGPPTFFDPYKIPHLKDRKKGEYLPDRLTDEAIQFLHNHQTANQAKKTPKPFLLFLWNYTVHWPMEAPEDLLKKYASRTGPGLNDTRYGAMIEAMDAAIGRLLKELDRMKLAKNTIVIFTSDNGGFGGVADNRPLRAAKGHLYEGGIRVPLMIRWPGVVKAGSLCEVPVISMDFFPTMLDIAIQFRQQESPEALKHHPLDGESLLPLLKQNGTLKRKNIFFHYPNYAWHRSNRLGSAIRSGQYKLIERFDDGSLELYDLQSDIGEKQNLTSRYPEKAKLLHQQLIQWRQQSNAAMPKRIEK